MEGQDILVLVMAFGLAPRVSTKFTRERDGGHENSSLSAGKFGLPNKLEKDRSNPKSVHGVFLGMIINTIEMTLLLPREKMVKILAGNQNAFETISSVSQDACKTKREIVRYLPMASALSLMKNQNYEEMVVLNKECREDLLWLIQHLEPTNGSTILKPC